MSWTKADKILVFVVFAVLFSALNVASYFIIKSILNVSIYEEKYDQENKRFMKKLGSKVHPFYGLADGNVVGFKSDISVERSFGSVSPQPNNDSKSIKVLVLGGSVASHLSAPRLNIPPYQLATKLNEYYNTDMFVVYNAAFGGGKQPQQFFKLMYLDFLGFKPDVIINYDGFNEIALPFGENLEEELNAIYPRKFNKLVSSSSYDGACFDVNNYLLSKNTYLPILELAKWVYVRHCHNVSTGMNNSLSGWSPDFQEEKQKYMQRTINAWEKSSDKIYDFAVNSKIPYFHFVQPNQYLEGSKPLSIIEKAEFTSYQLYGEPIARFYAKLDVTKLKASAKFDHRYLFKAENRTVYSDNCCHFNQLGMNLISSAIIKDASDVLDKVFLTKSNEQ